MIDKPTVFNYGDYIALKRRTEWVPVKDMLPDTHIEYYEPLDFEQAGIGTTSYQISDPVLICDKDGHMFVATYEDDGYGRTYWNDDAGTSYPDVIAWMQLPPAYKEDDKE